jgi:hypothetical protein
VFNPYLYQLKAGDVFVYNSGLGPCTFVRLEEGQMINLSSFRPAKIPENTQVEYLGQLTVKRMEWKS